MKQQHTGRHIIMKTTRFSLTPQGNVLSRSGEAVNIIDLAFILTLMWDKSYIIYHTLGEHSKIE